MCVASSRKCVDVCSQRMKSQSTAHAFHAWVAAVDVMHAARCAAERQEARVHQGLLLSSFAVWQQEVELMRCLEERATRAARTSMHRKLYAAFLEWRAVAFENVCHRHAIRYVHNLPPLIAQFILCVSTSAANLHGRMSWLCRGVLLTTGSRRAV